MQTTGAGEMEEKMDNFEPITEEELRELQKVSEPDDSISVPPYEGTTPEDAAGLEGMLDKKIGKMDVDEQSQYETMQQIADRGGVLPSDINQDGESFSNGQESPKKEGE